MLLRYDFVGAGVGVGQGRRRVAGDRPDAAPTRPHSPTSAFASIVDHELWGRAKRHGNTIARIEGMCYHQDMS